MSFQCEALACELPQEFLLVHSVLKGFAAVNENYRDLVVELAPKVRVRVNVDLLPGESSTPRKLGKTFFYYFAQVASFAGIDHNATRVWHADKF
jgi:hypothetical protein